MGGTEVHMCVQNSWSRPLLTCIPMMKQEADKEAALGGPSSDETHPFREKTKF